MGVFSCPQLTASEAPSLFLSPQNSHAVSSWQEEKAKAPRPVFWALASLIHPLLLPSAFLNPCADGLSHYAVHLLFLHLFFFRRGFRFYLHNHKSH